MTEYHVPVSLLNQIRTDLQPVEPLASPSRRLLALIPLALLLFVGPPMLYHWRDNLSLLSPWAIWGLSAFESCIGIALMWLALRQAVPGMSVKPRWIMLALFAGMFVFTGVSLTTADVLPTTMPDSNTWKRLAWECVVMELPFAIPSIAISAWLVARALPARPSLTGAIYGLSAGLMTDAGMRLFCNINESLHVFGAHGGVILLGVVGGALTAALIERGKYRRLQNAISASKPVT